MRWISFRRSFQFLTLTRLALFSSIRWITICLSKTGGDDWWQEILRNIAECHHFIYLLSLPVEKVGKKPLGAQKNRRRLSQFPCKRPDFKLHIVSKINRWRLFQQAEMLCGTHRGLVRLVRYSPKSV